MSFPYIATNAASRTAGSRRLRFAAAIAALGISAGTLAACSSDTDGGTTADGGANGTASSAANGTEGGAPSGSGESEPGKPAESTAVENPAVAPGEMPPGAPNKPIEQLLLNGTELPGYELTNVPQSQIADAIKQLGGAAEGVKVNPPECININKAAIDAQAAPNTTALATGTAAGNAFSMAVTTVTNGIREQSNILDRCSNMTMTLPLQGGAEAQMEAKNTRLDIPAPEGVENFNAVTQAASTTLSGQTQRTSTLTLNGVVRGIGVTATTATPNGEVSPAARDAVINAFTKQAEKIRNS